MAGPVSKRDMDTTRVSNAPVAHAAVARFLSWVRHRLRWSRIDAEVCTEATSDRRLCHNTAVNIAVDVGAGADHGKTATCSSLSQKNADRSPSAASTPFERDS